jgi:hypothetical protein
MCRRSSHGGGSERCGRQCRVVPRTPPRSSVFPMAFQFLRALLSVALLFPGVPGGVVSQSRAPSLEFRHRSSAPVRRWADTCIYELPGGFLAPCGTVYVAALTWHDHPRAPWTATGAGQLGIIRRTCRCPIRCQAPPPLYVPADMEAENIDVVA